MKLENKQEPVSMERILEVEKKLGIIIPKVYKEFLKTSNGAEFNEGVLYDIDTGGGEVLLSFQHPYHLTTVTEGFAPNVKLCKETLGTLGISVCEVTEYSQMPFEDNDRELVELLLPDCKKSFSGMNLKNQKSLFENAGFEILMSDEAYRPIEFYDVGALVWFAKIIQWEFVDFFVSCFCHNVITSIV